MQTLNAPLRSLLTLTLVAILGGCSTLPHDGPSGRAIRDGTNALEDSLGGYAIVDLDYGVSERVKAVPPQFFGSLSGASAESDDILIGAGDTLSVAIFEPSGALFGGGGGGEDGVRAGDQTLPAITVDHTGLIMVPFGGAVQVAGLTANQAAAAIRRSLTGKVGNPQVLVSIAVNRFNTVAVMGEVRAPGRAQLAANADRILDIIAATGGPTRPAEDIVVTIQREGQTFTAPLSVVTTEFSENVRLARGDRVNLTYRPRRVSTFGALGGVTLAEMPAGPLTLSGALSRAGGLDPNQANARSVMVFRFERPEVAAALGVTQAPTLRGVPVIYKLNMEEGSAFFTANNFMVQPDDILYAPRSDSAELVKFFTLVQTMTRVVYDLSVTSTLQN